MRLPRITIAGMMGLVVLAGLGIVALRESTEGWSWLVIALTLVVLAGAVVGAVVRHGAGRSSWVVFAAVGGAYLALCFAPWCAEAVEPRLPTTKLLDWLEPSVRRDRQGEVVFPRDRFDESYSAWSSTHPELRIGGDVALGDDPSTITLIWFSPGRDLFVRIGHCLLGLLLAVVAGAAARCHCP